MFERLQKANTLVPRNIDLDQRYKGIGKDGTYTKYIAPLSQY